MLKPLYGRRKWQTRKKRTVCAVILRKSTEKYGKYKYGYAMAINAKRYIWRQAPVGWKDIIGNY